MSNKIKLCKNCKYYKSLHEDILYGDAIKECRHEKAIRYTSPIDGSKSFYSCITMRSFSFACGRDARLYEEKEKKSLFSRLFRYFLRKEDK